MDWIEQLTGLNPDSGNGTLEALYFVVLAAIIVMIVFRVRVSRAQRRDRKG